MKITPITYSLNIKKSTGINNTSKNFDVSTKNNNIQTLSNYYYLPPSFSADKKRTYQATNPKLKEKSGDFLVCRYADIPCPSCGKQMLNRAKFSLIADELAMVPPDEYLKHLSKYQQYMRPVEESVYKELCKEAEKPNASQDIRTLLVGLRHSKLPVLQEAQMRQINKMTALAKSLPEDEAEPLLNKIKQLKGQIKKTNATAPFRRKIMIDRISKVKIRNPRKYEKLQRIAKNFPTSTDMNSAWIVKYSGKNKFNEDWDSYSIALRFLESSIANTDHIIAYDIDNTHDEISNYMAMHNACNGQKGNKPFLQWLNEDKKNRIQYMKDYFESVDRLIQDKKIKKKKYRNYVAYATKNIWEITKGEVQLFDEHQPEIHKN